MPKKRSIAKKQVDKQQIVAVATNECELGPAWTKCCDLFSRLEVESNDLSAIADCAERLRRFSPDHPNDFDHLLNVVSSVRRGVALLNSAIGWHDVRVGGSVAASTSTDEIRGNQWRLVIAYGGLETICKSLLNYSKNQGLGLDDLRNLTDACGLPPYPELVAPQYRTNVRERWFDLHDSQSQLELQQFLGLQNGAADALWSWLGERKSVQDWASALNLARAIRHATAHGALSADRCADWKLQSALHRLVTDISVLIAAALSAFAQEIRVMAKNPAGSVEFPNPREIEIPGIESITDIAVSPDGSIVACGLSDASIAIVDLRSDKVISRLKVSSHKDDFSKTFVEFSTDGKQLFGGSGKAVRTWSIGGDDPPNGRGDVITLSNDSDKDSTCVSDIKCAPDGQILAVGFLADGFRKEKTVTHLYDISNQRYVGALRPPSKLGAQCEAIAVAITPDSKSLIALSWGHKICRWDILKQRIVWGVRSPSLNGPMSRAYRYGIAISPDGSQCAIGACMWAQIHILDATNGTLVRTIGSKEYGRNEDILFSPDGNYLLASSCDVRGGLLKVIDLTCESDAGIRTFENLGQPDWTPAMAPFALHPCPSVVVTGAGNRVRIIRWDGQ